MSNIFKKFEGLKVRVQIVNGFGLPVDRQGYVEVEENWAYLYEKGQKGNRYIMAINTNRNSVVSVEVIHQKRNVDSRTSGESEGKFQNDTSKKVSFLWENDIQIELRYIAAVLAISDNDRDKIDAIISF